MRYAFAAVILTACTDVASITPDVCGNYVLETGEDCDRPGGACTADCRISCDPTQRATACTSADAIDGTCCPTDMTCGVDKVCHAQTGTVATTAIDSPYQDISFIVSDLDGDQIADMIGVSPNVAEIRYGSQSAPLSRIVTAHSPTAVQSAELGFGDFDGDQRPDLVIPTTTGLFAFTTDDGGLDPVQFPATVTPNVVHERVAYVGNLLGIVQGFVRLDYVPNHSAGQTNFQLALSTAPTYGVQSFNVVDQQTSMCGLSSVSADVMARPRAIHPVFDNSTIRVPFTIGGAVVGICVATANPNGHDSVGNPNFTSYSIPRGVWGLNYKPAGNDGETFFDNLIATSGCPDLIVPAIEMSTSADFTMILKGQSTPTNGCEVDMTPANAVFVKGKPFAPITLQPVTLLGTFGTAQPGLITSAGVYSFAGGTSTLVTAATRTWRYAVVGDLDGDGRQDFATVGTLDDVEVFRQMNWVNGLTPVEWNDYVISTANQVTLVALGNFDGDKAGDVAIGTVDTSTGTAVENLSIAWGNVDGTYDLEEVGAFPDAHSMTVLDLVDTSLPPGVDHNDDVLVARGGGDGTNPADPALMIAVYGSTSRVLTAPFVFASGFGSSSTTRAVGAAAQVGAYGDGQTAGVAAIFASPTNNASLGTSNTAMLDLTSQSYGGFTATPATLFSSCGAPQAGSMDLPFCASTARYTTMHRSTGDLLLGMRSDKDAGGSQCAAYFVANGAAPSLSTISCAALAPAAAASTDPVVESAFANITGIGVPKQLDNDGTTAQVALLIREPPQQAYLWDLTVNSGGMPELSNPIDLSHELATSGVVATGATVNCNDVARAELGTRTVGGTIYGDGEREYVVGCVITAGGVADTQIFARYLGPSGSTPHWTRLYDTGHFVSPIMRTGDVNGDGLDDLVFADGPSGRGTLHVLLQCDGHQTGCGGGQ